MAMKVGYLLLSTAVALGAATTAASAAKRQVGTCTSNPLQYPTIQAAVNAAQSGDQVQICPGTYQEEVTIGTAITLRNVPNQAEPTIAIPAGGAVQNTYLLPPNQTFPAAAQILVAPATPASVTVEYVIVDGSNNNIQTCGMELLGIYYQNAGGKIENVTTQNQMLPTGYQGCQSGEGIFVENQTVGTPQLSIQQNTVDTFDKNGITVSYAAALSSIDNNTVTGIGPTDVIAQNGIQLGYGASGTINGNDVSNLVYTPATYGSSGILLYDIPLAGALVATQVSNNIVSNAQYGVVLDAVDGAAGDLLPITKNTVAGAAFAGVGLYSDPSVPLDDDYINVASNTISGTTPYDNIDACSDNNSITSNTTSSSTEAGVHLDALCQEPDGQSTGVNNTVKRNRILNNCVGILSGPPVGQNHIGRNRLSGNTYNYEYGTDSWTCSAHRYMGKHRPASPPPPVQPLAHLARK